MSRNKQKVNGELYLGTKWHYITYSLAKLQCFHKPDQVVFLSNVFKLWVCDKGLLCACRCPAAKAMLFWA